MKPNDNPNLRIILAVAISLVFVVVYSYFQKPTLVVDSKTNQSTNTQTFQDLPKTSNSITSHLTESDSFDIDGAFNPDKNLATIVSQDFEITIDLLGRISQVYLKDKKFITPKQEGFFDHIKRLFGFAPKPEELVKLPLLGKKSNKPLEVRFMDVALNNQAFRLPYQASVSQLEVVDSPQTIILTQNLEGLVIKKSITFYPNLKYDVKIDISNENLSYAVSSGARPVADADGYAFHGVLLKTSEDKIEKIEDKKADEGVQEFDGAKFVASLDRYYTSLVFATKGQGLKVVIDAETDTHNPLPFLSFSGNSEFEGYIGPKYYKELKQIYPILTDVIEYGLITFFAKPMFLLLDFLHSYVGNWGWAIILLTLIVRIVLYPLSYKGMVGMQKLKELAPKMKEIQEKYKGDNQKLQIHMMELYKKHGANPMGGCLPLILQIPVFFAIYRVLYNAVELKSAEWILWINDLSVMDPYFVLPILMGISMYLHQVFTPSAIADPTQAKIFKFLPVVFTLFLITFPAGLVLYWTVSNIFSIIQQLLINKMLARKKVLEITLHKHPHTEVKK